MLGLRNNVTFLILSNFSAFGEEDKNGCNKEVDIMTGEILLSI